MTIKHVIFDLGNVLLNIHPEKAMEAFARTSKLPRKEIEKFFLSELHLGFMGGKYSSIQFFKKVKAKYLLESDFENFCLIWNLVIGEPKNGIIQFINQLNQKFTLSLCSNTDPIHWSYCLKQYPFLQNFRYYFLSFELKRNKPDPLIFEKMLYELKSKGEECVFIDDTLANIETAHHLAIRAIHAEDPQKIRAELLKLNLL